VFGSFLQNLKSLSLEGKSQRRLLIFLGLDLCLFLIFLGLGLCLFSDFLFLSFLYLSFHFCQFFGFVSLCGDHSFHFYSLVVFFLKPDLFISELLLDDGIFLTFQAFLGFQKLIQSLLPLISIIDFVLSYLDLGLLLKSGLVILRLAEHFFKLLPLLLHLFFFLLDLLYGFSLTFGFLSDATVFIFLLFDFLLKELLFFDRFIFRLPDDLHILYFSIFDPLGFNFSLDLSLL
jgi:hypothetical protein